MGARKESGPPAGRDEPPKEAARVKSPEKAELQVVAPPSETPSHDSTLLKTFAQKRPKTMDLRQKLPKEQSPKKNKI